MEHHLNRCGNCYNYFEKNYCNICGQAKAKRFTMKRLSHEIPHQFLHVDSQIVTTIAVLLSWPGSLINDYIAGKRKRYFPPLAYLFIMISLYFFCSTLVGNSDVNFKTNNASKGSDALKILEWMNHNKKILIIVMIPFFSIVSKIMFRKSKYNFAENIIINTYILGTFYVLLIILLLLGSIGEFNNSEIIDGYAFLLTIVIFPILSYYSVFCIFYKKTTTLIRSIFTVIFVYTLLALLALLVVGCFSILFDTRGFYMT